MRGLAEHENTSPQNIKARIDKYQCLMLDVSGKKKARAYLPKWYIVLGSDNIRKQWAEVKEVERKGDVQFPALRGRWSLGMKQVALPDGYFIAKITA